jgi:hypothetical protein
VTSTQLAAPWSRSRWESINDGLVRDNCFNHTDEIGERLALFGLSNSTILYVGSYWPDVTKERSDKVGARGLAGGGREGKGLREEGAQRGVGNDSWEMAIGKWSSGRRPRIAAALMVRSR